MGKLPKEFMESARNNKTSYLTYLDQLCEIALGRFEWDGLPETVDERFMELSIIKDGYVLFFKDENIGYVTLKASLAGPVNVYDIPIRREAYASNGYHAVRTNADSVIVWGNMLHTRGCERLINFSKDLYDLHTVMNINVKAQKTPIMILSDEKQRLTLKNLYMKYDGNQPFIFGNSALLGADSLKALNTGAPFLADKLFDLEQKIWNEALTFLGIANVSYTKKERMVTDEVDRGMGGVLASRYSALCAREQACEKINKLFGLNISVKFRGENKTDGGEYGDVYN